MDGDANLQAVREAVPPPPRDDVDDDSDRGSWLNPERQQQLWLDHQFPKCARPAALLSSRARMLTLARASAAARPDDAIAGQQERAVPKTMQLKQFHHRKRQEQMGGAAGRKSTAVRTGSAPGGAMRAARAMGAR